MGKVEYRRSLRRWILHLLRRELRQSVLWAVADVDFVAVTKFPDELSPRLSRKGNGTQKAWPDRLAIAFQRWRS